MAELEQAAELATEAVEEAVSVARNHISWMWGGWGIGAVMGTGVGYLLAMHKLEVKYTQRAEDEIDQMREHFRQRRIVQDKPPLDDLTKKVENLGYTRPTKPPVPVTPPAPGEPNAATPDKIHNVFTSTADWDYERELASRETGGIYVIHRDEYGAADNEEVTLTYYAGDDVLCDSKDRIIDNQTRLVGECLDQFGHGSGDRNVVCVRNEVLGVDLEVFKTDKTYAEEVHGLKHEEPQRRRHNRQR